MAGKVIDELITKWVYRVDTRQIRRAITAVKQFKNELRIMQQRSAFRGTSQEAERTRKAWRDATREVRRYRSELRRTSGVGAGGALVGGGRGGGPRGPRRGPFVLGPTGLGVGGLLGGFAAFQAARGIAASVVAGGTAEKQLALFQKFIGTREGQELFDSLNKFAKETPFSTATVRDMASFLLSQKVAAEQVLPLMSDLGNILAAVPQSNVRMREVLINLAQNVAAGFDTRQLRELEQRGMNIVPLIGQARAAAAGRPIPPSDIAAAQVREAMASGQRVSFEEVRKAIALLAETEFKGAMATVMSTTEGKLDRLGDEIKLGAEATGLALKPISDGVIDIVQFLLGPVFKTIGEGLTGLVEVGKTTANFLRSIDAVFKASKLPEATQALIDLVQGVRNLFAEGFRFESRLFNEPVGTTTDFFNFLARGEIGEAFARLIESEVTKAARLRREEAFDDLMKLNLRPPAVGPLRPEFLPSNVDNRSSSVRFFQTNNIQLAEGQNVEDALSDISQSARLLTTDYLGSLFFV